MGRVGRERVSDMGILRVQWVVRDRWPGVSGRARGVGRDKDGGGMESLGQRGRGRKGSVRCNVESQRETE